MHLPLHRLIIVAFAIVASSAAPALLAACGVVDRDLLVVVFMPSFGVGLVCAWFARRWPPATAPWIAAPARVS